MNPMASWPAMGSTGEVILFWCVAVVMVAGALGVLFFRRAAYAAIGMIAVMLGLAVLYFALGAPFLGAVQVVVYTGAIMMLFLFVLMMIGVGASDEYQRQRRGNLIGAVLLALGLTVVLGGVVARTTWSAPSVGIDPDPYSEQTITSLASQMFAAHWLSMELAGTLLITAAIGAILLTHTDRLGPAISQRTTAEAKMQAYRESGRHLGQLPAPGVYAQSNAVDVPALSGETLGPVEESVPRVLRVRGLGRPLSEISPEVAEALQLERSGDSGAALHGAAGSRSVPLSGAWGMPGPGAPTGLHQPVARPIESVEPSGPATTVPGEPEHLNAGSPGTDQVSGPGANAAPSEHQTSDTSSQERASAPSDTKEEGK